MTCSPVPAHHLLRGNRDSRREFHLGRLVRAVAGHNRSIVIMPKRIFNTLGFHSTASIRWAANLAWRRLLVTFGALIKVVAVALPSLLPVQHATNISSSTTVAINVFMPGTPLRNWHRYKETSSNITDNVI